MKCLKILAGLLCLGLIDRSSAAPLLELSLEKREYISGEPILVRVVVHNDETAFQFKAPGLSWGRRIGFTFDVGSNGGQMENIATPSAAPRLGGSIPFDQIEGF